MLLLTGLSVAVVVANVWVIVETRRFKSRAWVACLAHIGVAVLMAGLICSRGFEQQGETIVMKDHPGNVLGYEIRYRSMTSNDLDRTNRVLFDVIDTEHPDKVLFTADPGMYRVPSEDGQENTMVWPAIEHRPLYDVYFSLRPPQRSAGAPISIPVGGTSTIGGLRITYLETVRQGDPGTAGTRFGAKVRVDADGASKTITPMIQLGSGGKIVNRPAALDDALNVALVRLDAMDSSATIQVQMANPIYPIQVFHKPLTALVWLGTALITASGLLAAALRRVPSLAKKVVTKQSSALAQPQTARMLRKEEVTL
jgi:cytochrome c-type biogenesis protein CcmF